MIETMSLPCPVCDTYIDIPTSEQWERLGQPMQCPHCGATLVLEGDTKDDDVWTFWLTEAPPELRR